MTFLDASASAALVSRIPASNAQSISPDTHLRLTFDLPPTIGTSGQIRIFEAGNDTLVDTLDLRIPPSPPRGGGPTGAGTTPPATTPVSQVNTIGGFAGFHFYPIIVTDNTAVIYPHNNVLAYNRTYYVELDSGVLQLGTNAFAGFRGPTNWVFTTKPAGPPANSSRLVVAADGSGDFTTVQGAVDSIPDRNSSRVTIFIRNGVYREIVYFRNKSNLTFLGEDREGVVVGYANNEVFNLQPGVTTNERPQTNPYRRASFFADQSSGLQIVNLTLKNFTPRGGSQAEALLLRGGQNLVSHVNLLSFQDTLQFNDSVYITESFIEGETDFLWGRGPAFFHRCDIKELGRSPVMWVRSTAASHGFVFLECKFETPPGANPLLARNTAVYPNSEVVLLNSAVGEINPLAWSLAGDLSNQHYWEFRTTNLGDGQPADVSRRANGSKQLDPEKDAETIANYMNPSFVLGGWTPSLAPLILKPPATQTVNGGASVTFSVTVAAIPPAKYQWQRNGTPLKDGPGVTGASSPTLSLVGPSGGQAGDYTVIVGNSSGTATSAPARLINP